VWWCSSVIPALRRLNHEFQDSLSYIARPCLKKKILKVKNKLSSLCYSTIETQNRLRQSCLYKINDTSPDFRGLMSNSDYAHIETLIKEEVVEDEACITGH
jgi:hypothetical protein